MRMLMTAVALVAATSLLLTDARADSASERTPLQLAMEQVGESFKVLSRGLRNPDPAQGEAFVKAATTILKNLKEAKKYVPPRIAKLPLAQQPTILAAYQAQLGKTIKKVEELVSTLQAGDFEAASALVTELKVLRNDAHDQFQEEEKK